MGSSESCPTSKENKALFQVLESLQKETKKSEEINVPVEVIPKKFTETYYMKSFDKTERYPPIKDALDDLKCICSKSYIGDLYEKHKESLAKVVTSIWTKDIEFTKLINAALIVDSVKTFNKDVSEKNYKLMKEEVAKSGKTYTEIIDKSIKFMRLLNSYIVDKGMGFNTEDRVVYRGVSTEIFRNVECGKTFRIVNWSSCSEDLHLAKFFSGFCGPQDEKNRTVAKFNIKSGCYNAGKLNDIGMSCHRDEKETLLPPYTICTIKKKTKLRNTTLNSLVSDSSSYANENSSETFSQLFAGDETESETEITHLLEVDICVDNKSCKLEVESACYF
ncbi:unnamed protein product [Moneuplotes crassus]|uniref:Uncharacterized protein n=1 Tax=Euplotes crassus TaxID=5936 RepID=A0AAD2CWT6_EUPCR|nr:unnamed protein product [Moneuplotes crassus]